MNADEPSLGAAYSTDHISKWHDLIVPQFRRHNDMLKQHFMTGLIGVAISIIIEVASGKEYVQLKDKVYCPLGPGFYRPLLRACGANTAFMRHSGQENLKTIMGPRWWLRLLLPLPGQVDMDNVLMPPPSEEGIVALKERIQQVLSTWCGGRQRSPARVNANRALTQDLLMERAEAAAVVAAAETAGAVGEVGRPEASGDEQHHVQRYIHEHREPQSKFVDKRPEGRDQPPSLKFPKAEWDGFYRKMKELSKASRDSEVPADRPRAWDPTAPIEELKKLLEEDFEGVCAYLEDPERAEAEETDSGEADAAVPEGEGEWSVGSEGGACKIQDLAPASDLPRPDRLEELKEETPSGQEQVEQKAATAKKILRPLAAAKEVAKRGCQSRQVKRAKQVFPALCTELQSWRNMTGRQANSSRSTFDTG
eukprot:s3162_g4.t1